MNLSYTQHCLIFMPELTGLNVEFRYLGTTVYLGFSGFTFLLSSDGGHGELTKLKLCF